MDLQKEEKSFLEELDKVIRFDEPLPPEWWVDGDSLRFVYEFEWDFTVVCEVYCISFCEPDFVETQGALQVVEWSEAN